MSDNSAHKKFTDSYRVTNEKNPGEVNNRGSNQGRRTLNNKPHKLPGLVRYFGIGVLVTMAVLAGSNGEKGYAFEEKIFSKQDKPSFEKILKDSKKIIGATKILDKSSITGSNTYCEWYTITLEDGTVLEYKARIDDGARMVTCNQIPDEVREAIRAVGNAQNGTELDLRYASRILDEMKENPQNYDLSYLQKSLQNLEEER